MYNSFHCHSLQKLSAQSVIHRSFNRADKLAWILSKFRVRHWHSLQWYFIRMAQMLNALITILVWRTLSGWNRIQFPLRSAHHTRQTLDLTQAHDPFNLWDFGIGGSWEVGVLVMNSFWALFNIFLTLRKLIDLC